MAPRTAIQRLTALPALADRCLDALDNLLLRLRTHALGDAPTAAFLLAPALVILGLFGLAPLFYAIYMSLFGGKLGVGPFVGLANYATALHSQAFWKSVLVTLYYAAGVIPTAIILSLFIAHGLFHMARGRRLFQTLFFLPYVTSAVAAAMVWRAILNPQFGPANALLSAAGFNAQEWLLEPRSVLWILTGGAIPAHIGPSLALTCVILFEIWHTTGFMIVILLAGLTAIPRELGEAARIDGANAWQELRNISLPLLSPTLFFLAIVSLIKSFQAFNGIYALTGNGHGPLGTTRNLTIYIYSEFYEYHRWGYGAAVATLLCAAVVGLTLIQWRYIGKKVHYE